MKFDQIMEENSKPKQPYGQVLLLHTVIKKLDYIMQMLEEQRLRTEHLSTRISRQEKHQRDPPSSQTIKRLP
jgi:hypothetical protein